MTDKQRVDTKIKDEPPVAVFVCTNKAAIVPEPKDLPSFCVARSDGFDFPVSTLQAQLFLNHLRVTLQHWKLRILWGVLGQNGTALKC